MSKLNLTTLNDLHCLDRLEILIASDNKFEDVKKLGTSLGYMTCLVNANFLRCPAQRDIHYRETLTAGSFMLENLDEKTISSHSREFIKKFEQLKYEKKLIKSQTSEMENPSLLKQNSNTSILSPTRSAPNVCLLNGTNNSLEYKSWNQYPLKKLRRNLQQRNQSGSSIKSLPSDVVIQGTVLTKNFH